MDAQKIQLARSGIVYIRRKYATPSKISIAINCFSSLKVETHSQSGIIFGDLFQKLANKEVIVGKPVNLNGETSNWNAKKSDIFDRSYQDEMKEFNSYYAEIVKALVWKSNQLIPDMRSETNWMVKVLDYNVSGGKKLRGLLVPVTYRSLVENPTSEQIKLANILGWVEEMLQGASTIADDIMDNSETRRGKMCWYKQTGVGMLAVNDCLLLENLAYKLMRIYFEHQPYYLDLIHTLKEGIIKTIYGQGLDCKMGKSKNILENFTIEKYMTIVKYKTSYYTMYLPVALAMVMAGKHKNQDAMKIVEEILLEVGYYFQVQDDYMDCFGNEKITGKIGTDIQDNKCTWLFVQAVQRCNPFQLQCLLENYGQHDPQKIEKVKNLYRDLELDEAFADFEQDLAKKIANKINELPDDISVDVFKQLFIKIYQRKK